VISSSPPADGISKINPRGGRLRQGTRAPQFDNLAPAQIAGKFG